MRIAEVRVVVRISGITLRHGSVRWSALRAQDQETAHHQQIPFLSARNSPTPPPPGRRRSFSLNDGICLSGETPIVLRANSNSCQQRFRQFLLRRETRQDHLKVAFEQGKSLAAF